MNEQHVLTATDILDLAKNTIQARAESRDCVESGERG